MSLANMRDLLDRARDGGYAVGSFSVANMECIEGVLAAAEETGAPIIMQIAEPRVQYSPLYLVGPMMMAAARAARVPVAVHLDHGRTLACIREALDLGFTSVMYDGSLLPIEENIATTREVQALAKAYGASVEAEVGCVGKGEDGSDCPVWIARIEDCERMDGIGVDALAVGIGNAHGLYAQKPHLRYDVLESLRGNMNAHLVLHGGTGLTNEQFRKLIALGMRKINIATDIFMAASSAQCLCDIFSSITNAREQVSAVVRKYVALFGCAGKAE